MILRSFASNQPYTLIFAVALLIAAYLWPEFSSIPLHSIGYSAEYICPKEHWAVVIISIVLTIVGGLLANRLFNLNEFTNTPVFMPAVMYMLVMTTLGITQLHMPTLASNVFLIMGLQFQLRIYKQPNILGEVFLSGFLFGIASLIVPSMITLLPALIIGILANRSFNLREIFLAIVSYFLPFVYWLSLSYLLLDAPDYILVTKTISLDKYQYLQNLGWLMHVFSGMIIVSLVFALRQFTMGERSSNRAKSARINAILISIAIFISFFLNYLLTGHWLLQTVAFPVSFITAYWFAHYRYSVLAPFFFYAICVMSIILSFRMI